MLYRYISEKNRFFSLLVSIPRDWIPASDFNENGMKKTELSYFRLVAISEVDMEKTFSLDKYLGFAPSNIFKIQDRLLKAIQETYHNKTPPSLITRSLVNKPDVESSSSVPDEEDLTKRKKTKKLRAIKEVDRFDPKKAYKSDLKRKKAIPIAAAGKKAKRSVQDEEEDDFVEEIPPPLKPLTAVKSETNLPQETILPPLAPLPSSQGPNTSQIASTVALLQQIQPLLPQAPSPHSYSSPTTGLDDLENRMKHLINSKFRELSDHVDEKLSATKESLRNILSNLYDHLKIAFKDELRRELALAFKDQKKDWTDAFVASSTRTQQDFYADVQTKMERIQNLVTTSLQKNSSADQWLQESFHRTSSGAEHVHRPFLHHSRAPHSDYSFQRFDHHRYSAPSQLSERSGDVPLLLDESSYEGAPRDPRLAHRPSSPPQPQRSSHQRFVGTQEPSQRSSNIGGAPSPTTRQQMEMIEPTQEELLSLWRQMQKKGK